MKAFLKILIINGLVFAALIACLELVLGNWLNINKSYYTCHSKYYHHNYCSNISHITEMSESDGGRTIQSHVNTQGIVVPSQNDKNKSLNLQEYDIIMIGDSYMQADELTPDEKISSLITKETGLKAVQIGYASWAPVQFYNFLKENKFKKGARIWVFLMMNDFGVNYVFTNWQYHQMAEVDNEGLYSFEKPLAYELSWKSKVKQFLLQNSFLYLKWQKFRSPPVTTDKAPTNHPKLKADFSSLSNACEELKNVETIAKPYSYDFIVFSFNSECWPENYVKATNSVIHDLDLIKGYTESEGLKLHVFIIPVGFSFAGENVEGKQMPAYNLDKDTLITSVGVDGYLKQNYAGDFTNLEHVLKNLKSENPDQLLYLPLDGHWNEYTHQKLSEFLIRYLRKNEHL